MEINQTNQIKNQESQMVKNWELKDVLGKFLITTKDNDFLDDTPKNIKVIWVDSYRQLVSEIKRHNASDLPIILVISDAKMLSIALDILSDQCVVLDGVNSSDMKWLNSELNLRGVSLSLIKSSTLRNLLKDRLSNIEKEETLSDALIKIADKGSEEHDDSNEDESSETEESSN